MQKLTQQMLNNVFVLPNIPLHLCIVNQYSYKNNVLFLVKKVFNILLSLFIAITATNAQVPVVLDLSDASADVGNTISIDVTVKNFNEILGGQFTIKWDATAITFLNEPYNFGLQSIAINNFNTTNAPDGELRFGWIADVNGESLPDDAVLFSMDFLIDEKRPVLIDFDTDELAQTPIDFQNLTLGDLLPVLTYSGNINFTKIKGKVFYDANNGCDFNLGESGQRNIPVTVRNTTTNVLYFGSTDANGDYDIPVSEGSYQVFVRLPNEYWQACANALNCTVTNASNEPVRNFPISKPTLCSDLAVNVVTPHLKRCTTNRYTIFYRNEGTADAINAYVEIELDPYFNFQSASLPAIQQGANKFLLFLPNGGILPAGNGGVFYLDVFLACDALLGQTHSIKAHIKPDESCLPTDPTWDGAHIAVEGACVGDSIQFIIRNTGNSQIQPTNNFIVEDDLMLMQAPVRLENGEATIIKLEATGKTYRIIAEQSEGHPGNSKPTVAVEACTTSGNISTGYVLYYPEDESDKFISVDCQQNTDTVPSFKLAGFPVGAGEEHLIDTTTEIDYLINFQNTTSSIVQRIVIRDTLSSLLDITSLQPGASSHPYTYKMLGNGIIEFVFEQTALDTISSTNEHTTQGFLTFRLAQRPNNPVGSIIFNSAAIYFDYDTIPNITNQTTHKIDDHFLELITNSSNNPQVQQYQYKVYPNPFIDFTTIEILGDFKNRNRFTLNVFDLYGRNILSLNADSPTFRITKDILPAAGNYLFHISSEQNLLSSGKLIVH